MGWGYAGGMTGVFVQVVERATGKWLPELGPFESAAAARRACSIEEDEALVWTRLEDFWEAVTTERVYRVLAETQFLSQGSELPNLVTIKA